MRLMNQSSFVVVRCNQKYRARRGELKPPEQRAGK